LSGLCGPSGLILILLSLPCVCTLYAATLSPEERGDIFMARAQYAAAIDAYRLQPRPSARTLISIGLAYYRMLGFDEARKYFEKALAQDPRNVSALSNSGAAYFNEGDYDHALRCFVRAHSFAPNDATVLANIGAVYLVLGKYRQAVEEYRQAIAFDPSILHPNPRLMVDTGPPSRSPSVNFCLAEIYAIAGRNSEAITYLKKAVSAGFHDRKRLMTDADLGSIRSTVDFQQLLAAHH
jgi:tetratricopeptide (TPR) repeat protein